MFSGAQMESDSSEDTAPVRRARTTTMSRRRKRDNENNLPDVLVDDLKGEETVGGKRRICLLTIFIVGHSRDEHLEPEMSRLEEKGKGENSLPHRHHRRTLR